MGSVVKHLGMLYKKLGQLDKARPLYQQTAEFRERVFGPNHPSLATALVNLAVICSQQGCHGDAQPLYEQALRIYEDCFGPSHPRLSETLRNLALCKYEQGEYETAARLYKRSTEIRDGDNLPGNYPQGKVARRQSSNLDTASGLRNSINIQGPA